MNNKLKIVLDTNVFLVSIATHFKYFWVYEKLQQGEYELYVSNEILTEYQEQIAKRFGLLSADSSLYFLLPFLFLHLNLILPQNHPHTNRYIKRMFRSTLGNFNSMIAIRHHTLIDTKNLVAKHKGIFFCRFKNKIL